jgi:uncharacterized protein (DUF427 family)
MYKAIWNNQIIAVSSKTIEIEGNQYFPPEDVKLELFSKTETHSTCPWKGYSSYYNITVDGKTNSDAAWFYEKPKDAVKEIAGYVAFWKGVEVIKS